MAYVRQHIKSRIQYEIPEHSKKKPLRYEYVNTQLEFMWHSVNTAALLNNNEKSFHYLLEFQAYFHLSVSEMLREHERKTLGVEHGGS